MNELDILDFGKIDRFPKGQCAGCFARKMEDSEHEWLPTSYAKLCPGIF